MVSGQLSVTGGGIDARRPLASRFGREAGVSPLLGDAETIEFH